MALSALAAVRQRIVTEATVLWFAKVALFEVLPGQPSRYGVAFLSVDTEPAPKPLFSRDSLLVRWLRSNATYLAVPDSIGLWDELCESDRVGLREFGVGGCSPLVFNEDLIGWLSPLQLGGRASFGHASDVRRKTEDCAKRWAVDLYEAQANAVRTSQSEAVSRSNRLSVTGQMAAGIAHEVRNPLASIRSTVQLVKEEDLDRGKQRLLLERVLEDVDRINRVIGEMMTLGKPRTSRFETCNVSDLVRTATTFCVPYSRRLEQHLDCQVVPGVFAGADPVELRQVVVNLILNACQASQPGDLVTVQLTVDETQTRPISIKVIDLGGGMAPDVLERACEPFYSTKTDGVGLGLAICGDIVRRHRGDLSLKSELGRGTVATINLPR